jgi:hypothetical protein
MRPILSISLLWTIIQILIEFFGFEFVPYQLLASESTNILSRKSNNSKQILPVCLPKTKDDGATGRCLAGNKKCPEGFLKVRTSMPIGPKETCNVRVNEAVEL